jgi:hypothetical protein
MARKKKTEADPDLFALVAPPNTTRICLLRCGYLEHTLPSPVHESVYERWGYGDDGRRAPGSWFFCPVHRESATLLRYEFEVKL